jgi:hypothetical protein
VAGASRAVRCSSGGSTIGLAPAAAHEVLPRGVSARSLAGTDTSDLECQRFGVQFAQGR